MKLIKFLLSVALCALIVGCSADFNVDQSCEEQLYVSLPESTDFSNLSQEEQKIVFSVSYRFAITEDEDGFFSTKVTSGREINVSENIYNFYLAVIENTNSAIENEKINLRYSLMSRSPEDVDYFRKIDCLAWSISAATNYSYDEVSTYIYDNYNQGRVHYTQGPLVMSAFGTVTCVVDPGSNRDFGSNCIVVLKNSNGSYHAVNGVAIDPNTVYFMDYQASPTGEYGIRNRSDIYMIYEISSFR